MIQYPPKEHLFKPSLSHHLLHPNILYNAQLVAEGMHSINLDRRSRKVWVLTDTCPSAQDRQAGLKCQSQNVTTPAQIFLPQSFHVLVSLLGVLCCGTRVSPLLPISYLYRNLQRPLQHHLQRYSPRQSSRRLHCPVNWPSNSTVSPPPSGEFLVLECAIMARYKCINISMNWQLSIYSMKKK